jgi:multiple sugar transport system substrate-binding protein
VGIPGYGQGEMITAFLQGQAAMYLDSSLIFGQVNDPAKSKIGGQVSYVVHPKGVRYSSQSGGLGLAIPKNAKNADAAFLLLQWLTSKAQDKAVAKAGGVPTRNSTLATWTWCASTPSTSPSAPAAGVLRPRLAARSSPCGTRSTSRPWAWAVSEALTGKKTPEDALNGMVPKVTAIMRARLRSTSRPDPPAGHGHVPPCARHLGSGPGSTSAPPWR